MRRWLLSSFVCASLAGCEGVIGDPGIGGDGPGPGPVVVDSEDERALLGRQGVRRLTRDELARSVLGAIGVDVADLVSTLPADSFAGGFDNNWESESQEPSTALVSALDLFAERVAERATDAMHRDAVVGCTPSAANDAACFRSFLDDSGRRMFRRPLAVEELDAYASLIELAVETDDFYEAVRLAIRAMLQSDSFLYRVEIGTPVEANLVALDGYELASRLSFFLWGSGPDDALLDAAAEGMLETPAGVRAEAERLLADDRARARVARFHAMWLGWESAAPTLPSGIGLDLEAESAALIERVVFDDRASWFELFTSTQTYVNPALAEHYGMEPVEGWTWVDYADSDRAGILSHGTFLSVGALLDDTSPIRRGKAVRERLLCQHIPTPSEAGIETMVDVDRPPGDPNTDCKWDRYAIHRDNGQCRSCHELIEPVGFGLEAFDTLGRRRTHDIAPATGEPIAACPIRDEGEVVGVGTETFSGPAELGELLIDSGALDQCLVRNFFRFAAGREENDADDPMRERLLEEFRGSDHRFDDLVLALVVSPAFRHRLIEP